MSEMPLGVSTWCFNGLMPAELRSVVDGGAPYQDEHAQAVHAYFSQLCSAILRSMINCVELWHSAVLHDEQVLGQLRRLAAGCVSSVHGPFGSSLDISSSDEDVRLAGVAASLSAADLLAKLGGKTLVVHGSTPVEASDAVERTNRCAASLGQIADHCLNLGIGVAVELLAGPFVGGSAESLAQVLRLADRVNIGVCIDVNHAFPPESLIPTVEILAPRILGLHISDYDGVNELHRLPGEGTIDWRALIRALRKVGYRGAFTYEARFEAEGIDQAVNIIEENYRRLMSTR
jgi:sugar phosphate isomerase/epimerase